MGGKPLGGPSWARNAVVALFLTGGVVMALTGLWCALAGILYWKKG